MPKMVTVTNRELQVLEIMWNFGRPMRRNEMIEVVVENGIPATYINPVLNKLLDKELIKVVEIVKVGNIFGRTYLPVITREEYYALQLKKNASNVNPEIISKIVIALIGDSDDQKMKSQTIKCLMASFVDDAEFDDKTINKLKKFIDEN